MQSDKIDKSFFRGLISPILFDMITTYYSLPFPTVVIDVHSQLEKIERYLNLAFTDNLISESDLYLVLSEIETVKMLYRDLSYFQKIKPYLKE